MRAVTPSSTNATIHHSESCETPSEEHESGIVSKTQPL